MTHYEVEERIEAPAERIWAILTDARLLAAGGRLGITRLDGDIQPGRSLKLWSEAAPAQAFALKVQDFDPPRRMTWVGGMPFGLFKGVRTFSLTPDGGAVRFHMREEFTGPLAPMIAKSIPDLTPSFTRFAAGLKQLSEKQP